MTAPAPPKPPTGLGRRGKAFWAKITARYDLADSELELLTEVVRTIDACEALAGESDVRSLGEARQQRLVLGRLLAQLQIPSEEIESPRSRQARQAAETRWALKKRGSSA